MRGVISAAYKTKKKAPIPCLSTKDHGALKTQKKPLNQSDRQAAYFALIPFLKLNKEKTPLCYPRLSQILLQSAQGILTKQTPALGVHYAP